MHRFLIGIATLGLVTACQVEREETSSGKLVNGTLAKAGDYASTIVYLSSSGSRCTGTRISTTHIITAAHCVTDAIGKLTAAFAPNQLLKATNFPTRTTQDTSLWHSNRIKKVEVNPDWTFECSLPGRNCRNSMSAAFLPPADVAVIEVKSALPSQWPAAKIDRQPVYNYEDVSIVGYGCEYGIYGEKSSTVRKKYADTYTVDATEINKPTTLVSNSNLDTFDSRYMLTPGSHYNYESSSNRASLCPGDSGGPVYRTGTLTLVGVHADYSFYDANDGYSWVNVHTRLADPNGYNPNLAYWLEGILPASSFTN